MAKKDPKNTPDAVGTNNVVEMGTSSCRTEKCTKKSYKLSFCAEHYAWFKEGLINRNGEKPSDFDKKYQAYMRRQQKAA